jgi:hypothetical protein
MNGDGNSMIAVMCIRDASGAVTICAPEKGCRERRGRAGVTSGCATAEFISLRVATPCGCCWGGGKCLAAPGPAWSIAAWVEAEENCE